MNKALRFLADALPGEIESSLSDEALTQVSGVVYDSRKITPGCLFVCLPGAKADGHDFAASAMEAGAAALMIQEDHERALASISAPKLIVSDTRRAMPLVAARFFDAPSSSLDVIGVTGTNGKTTVSYMIAAVLRQAGIQTAVIGTVGVNVNGKARDTHWTVSTTPESVDLQELLASLRDEGVQAVVMEVTSIGIDQHRTDGIAFRTAVFTNLTQDHGDYHGNMANYRAAKQKLFTEYPRSAPDRRFTAVLNADDEVGELFAGLTSDSGHDVVRYGIKASMADITAKNLRVHPDGTDFEVVERAGEKCAFDVSLPVGGVFNVSNALAAIAVARSRNITVATIQEALANLTPVPGRFEPVPAPGRDFHVLVDYAHTPDGLENVLKSARALKPRRLIALFGCGGNRDRTKRPQMGKIAANLADVVIVTSDNPRFEEPGAIIDEIMAGIDHHDGRDNVRVEADRRKAIHAALCEMAGPGDLVVIAGKGHEDYQEIKGVRHPFDDRVVAAEELRKCD
jgi:UDP-N-acetylmuramoyl-L-alanyl-D-glutamate--2,6-diaminopimelate ligase